jgi:solute carrier family 13 (sodium-dependent dicarboxylate transporter), member 2/3/5
MTTEAIALVDQRIVSPPWPDAWPDPLGKHFALSREAKGALAVFMLAGTWWVFEVVPIGITSLAIGVLQALFMIRRPCGLHGFHGALGLFIFASIMIGLVFTKTGLTKRLAYKMLMVVGERTSMIMLGCLCGHRGLLTHIMAHTAVAATIYPLLISIYALYGEGDKKTKFGKGLFMGMAYVAGAGSIITLLGAARGAVALDFFARHPANSRSASSSSELLHVPHRDG